ncbi:MAG: hypothetical protein IPP36_13130 [Nitrosomonadales bacterium]|nr:hypothetical protein [Nitrosomonadales bacterium]
MRGSSHLTCNWNNVARFGARLGLRGAGWSGGSVARRRLFLRVDPPLVPPCQMQAAHLPDGRVHVQGSGLCVIWTGMALPIWRRLRRLPPP